MRATVVKLQNSYDLIKYFENDSYVAKMNFTLGALKFIVVTYEELIVV